MKRSIVTSVQPQSLSIPDTTKEEGKEKQEQLSQRKITQAIEGFAIIKYPETIR
jgi:hypothetical protein